MPVTPDLTAFRDAQRRLREQLGRDVRFYGPASATFDPLTPVGAFDPETGLPYDPTIAPSYQNEATSLPIDGLALLGTVRASVVFQPLAAMRRDEVAEDALGIRSRLNKDLIVDIDDLATVEAASYFQLGQTRGDTWTADEAELWKVVNVKIDGIGAPQRVVVFGQGTE